MTLQIEYPKDATRKLLKQINEFGKFAVYKINTPQKLIAFLYTNYERSEQKIQETIPFTIASNINKNIGISLLGDKRRPIYSENYKM